MGALYEWVDFELIRDLAASNKSWSLVMVGPKRPGRKTVNLPNIHYLGRKPYSVLPGYIQHFDVCIIPFRLSQTTLGSSPVKLYEYMASGKPVVSTDIPEAVKFREVIKIAGDSNGFAAHINYFLNEDPADRRRRLKLQLDTAKKNTWLDRYFRIKNLLKNYAQ